VCARTVCLYAFLLFGLCLCFYTRHFYKLLSISRGADVRNCALSVLY